MSKEREGEFRVVQGVAPSGHPVDVLKAIGFFRHCPEKEAVLREIYDAPAGSMPSQAQKGEV